MSKIGLRIIMRKEKCFATSNIIENDQKQRGARKWFCNILKKNESGNLPVANGQNMKQINQE